jgi:tRNA (cmo5U34)-methyltransferase|tara:strand:- start:49 stop:678 length:630 start_codon:yes stop_codon:yes gene_type:complete
MFDFKSIQDFDKHINLSIPNYKNLSNVFSGITCAFAQPESSVVDIGCSTGRFLSSLPKTKNCKYIGIDESVLQNSFNNFEFIQADIEKALPDIKNISVIVSMFTLQFLGKLKRERVLAKIKEIINNGAVFLVAEKVYLDDPVIQTLVHKMHIQEKRKSFTDKDILNKDTQLAVSMFCKTETQLTKELNKIGNVSKVWQSYNFMGFCVKT